MTILPIVERELRVAARRRATYWTRLLVALAAIVVGSIVLFINITLPPARLGTLIFTSLAFLALVQCLLSGRLSTADCLSEEKREGTLGLLFLTDLKGYDVVLGKLFATSLGSFYGLLALFPVLAIPLLMGGVTNTQFWLMTLVLANTFLFSLAIGMFSSALSHDHRKAMGINFGLLIFFILVLPAFVPIISLTFGKGTVIQQLFFTCPFYGFFWVGVAPFLPAATGTAMTTPPPEFWQSLALIHGLTWLFLFLSAQIVPHSWQDRPAAPVKSRKGRLRELWKAWSFGNPARRPAYRKMLLDINAFYWHAARARLKPLHVWVFFGMMALWWIGGRLLAGTVWLDETTNLTMALMLNTTLKLWLAAEAGQRLADDKRIGALELLLSTPLTARDILRGQMLALRRQFLGPVVVVLFLEFFLMNQSAIHAARPNPSTYSIWLTGMFMLPLDLLALISVSMARALTEKNFNRALVGAVARVLILPWVAYGAVVAIAEFWHTIWLNQRWEPSTTFYLGWWFTFGLAADLWFGLRAYFQLLHQLREIATPTGAVMDAAVQENVQPTGPGAFSLLGHSAIVKNFIRALVAFVVLLGVFFYFYRAQPKYPPPVSVPVSLSQGPLRISDAANGALFILPDGSAWHWGKEAPGFSNALSPARFGTNSDWSYLSFSYAGFAGLRKDGTLWQSNVRLRLSGPITDGLTQIGDDTNWLQVSSSGNVTFGLKRDGTLWGWGDNSLGQLAKPPDKKQPLQSTPIQIGVDSNWAVVNSSWSGATAIKTDGTLWAWGTVHFYGFNKQNNFNLTNMTQVTSDTNWAGFEPGFFTTGFVRNRAGVLWEPFYAKPNADLSAGESCHLALTNVVSDKFAFAYVGKTHVYQLHPDGTLWERFYPMAMWSGEPDGKWQRVGKRSDWLSIHGENGIVFGLTSDGTLWTWGVDPTLDPVPDFGTKLMMFRTRIGQFFGGPAPSPSMTGNAMPQFQKEPRPLMKLKP